MLIGFMLLSFCCLSCLISLFSICSLNLFLPCLSRLIFQKGDKRVKLLSFVPGFKSSVISFSVFFVNDNRRVIMQKKNIVHYYPARPAVAVGKGVDILKLCVEIRSGSQSVVFRYLVHFGHKFGKLFGNVFRRCADLVFTRDKIVMLILSRAFSELPSAGIIGVLRQLISIARVRMLFFR